MTSRLYNALRTVAFVGLYFVALPAGFVALNERLGWPRFQGPVFETVGTLLIVLGVGVCGHIAWMFWSIGRGTPVPTQPPERLVVSGLHRFSRHPMYVAYITIGVGVFFVEGHLALLLYPVVLFLLVQTYLVTLEEPGLVKRFGSEYEEYRRRVPRWPRPRRDGATR